MPRNYFLLNLILLIVIGILGIKFYKVWVKPLDIPTQINRQQQVQKDKKNPADKKGQVLNHADYEIIVQKNLFHPSRAVQPADTFVQSFPPPKLFGTIITNKGKSAILEDPSTKITRLYHINDSLAGFIVSDIQQDKVILLRGTAPVEVKLREIKAVTSQPYQRPPSVPPHRRQPSFPRPSPHRPSPPAEVAPPPSPPIVPPEEEIPPPLDEEGNQ